MDKKAIVEAIRFQSPLHRRGQPWNRTPYLPINCFNPRSSCGEQLAFAAPSRRQADFNPRSLCREQLKGEVGSKHISNFQSPLPL